MLCEGLEGEGERKRERERERRSNQLRSAKISTGWIIGFFLE